MFGYDDIVRLEDLDGHLCLSVWQL
jgi:hypothetical protein